MKQENSDYNDIPTQTLNSIARDPVVFFGCSMREIYRGMVIFFITVFVPILIVFFFIHLAIGLVIGFVSWGISCRLYYSSLSKKRSDKPLFYEDHLKKKKKAIFITPNANYQRIKNID